MARLKNKAPEYVYSQLKISKIEEGRDSDAESIEDKREYDERQLGRKIGKCS